MAGRRKHEEGARKGTGPVEAGKSTARGIQSANDGPEEHGSGPKVGSGIVPFRDSLSPILDSVHLRTLKAGARELVAPWGVHLRSNSMGFYAVTQGEVWFTLDGPVRRQLQAGDFVIIDQGQNCQLSDEPNRPSVPMEQWSTEDAPIHCYRQRGLSSGEPTIVIWGHFLLNEGRACPWLADLYPLIHVKNSPIQTGLWLKELGRIISTESGQRQPGALATVSGLIKLLLIQAVYSCMGSSGNKIRLGAMADPYIGPALGLMHQHPELPWSVSSLADEIGMSRSAFAARFMELMGESPMRYLLSYRMDKACQILADEQPGLKALALRLGYSSAAAFSSAFRRWAGYPPGGYRRRKSAPKSEIHG
jgi:AraC-like DNA-binding protein